jgi:hypothetical protein
MLPEGRPRVSIHLALLLPFLELRRQYPFRFLAIQVAGTRYLVVVIVRSQERGVDHVMMGRLCRWLGFGGHGA